MAWYWIALLSFFFFAVLIIFAGGWYGHKRILTRRKLKGAANNMQKKQDPNRPRRLAMEEAGTLWVHAQNPEEVELTAYDGLTLRGYYIPAKEPSGKLVICIHGYSYNAPDQFGALMPFYHDVMGYDILLPDLRAHGRSDGTYNSFGGTE